MNESALKERLKIIAKEKNISMNQIWKQLVLERFLARLSMSRHQSKLIFKGGLLLAHYLPIQRETTDLDFLANKINNDFDEIKIIIEEIVSVKINDNFLFKFSSSESLSQPHMEYDGFRISLNVKFGKMTDQIQVDIATGDSVYPVEENFTVFMYKGKPIFSGAISLLVYPKETIFTEKLETIISKGNTNSRMKDYHDVLLMIREPNFFDIDKLKNSLEATFTTRGANLAYLIPLDEKENLQPLWQAHVRKLGNILKLPLALKEVIEEINEWLRNNKI